MRNLANSRKNWPTILCVDDDPAVVDSIERNLRHYSVNIEKALHGMQGIWIANTSNADLIVTDFKMPFANGLELVEIMRQTPVIVVTGVSDPAIESQLYEAGAAAVLHKPVSAERLREHIERFVPLSRRSSPKISLN